MRSFVWLLCKLVVSCHKLSGRFEKIFGEVGCALFNGWMPTDGASSRPAEGIQWRQRSYRGILELHAAGNTRGAGIQIAPPFLRFFSGSPRSYWNLKANFPQYIFSYGI